MTKPRRPACPIMAALRAARPDLQFNELRRLRREYFKNQAALERDAFNRIEREKMERALAEIGETGAD